MILGFIADYVRLCHVFNTDDPATRANVRSILIPRLAQERKSRALALWSCRKTRWNQIGSKDMRVFLDDLRAFRNAVRAAKARLAMV